MFLTAQVAVWDATIYYDKLYTYEVPALLEGHIFVGSLVLVPFGRGKTRPRMGVVLQLQHKQEANARLKSVLDVAPEEAALTSELLLIVTYLKHATFSTWYEAVKTVLPRGAQYKVEQQQDAWVLKQQMSRHTETVYTLAVTPPQAGRKLTAKQQQVLDFLQPGAVTRAALMQHCSVGRSVPETLVQRGYLQSSEQDKSLLMQDVFGRAQGEEKKTICLSAVQQQVADSLLQSMQQVAPKPALLHGVTGSGKTAIFLTLVQEALQQGKTALVLVPEIGLTPQMIAQLRGQFGSLVAVQHSKLSNMARLLQWRAIQRGEAKVVVGTRSAVFAPLENIGIIVVDEEQERTYQSESAPRYDAIEVAKRRAVHHGALLVLASATPAISDYYLAKAGRYDLFLLQERYGELPLPAVELVDMQQERAAGNMGIISNQLAQSVQQTIDAGMQVILLLNRRGYNRVGVCRDCGEALKCTECSVPMVLHRSGKQNNKQGEERLMCHYCGKTMQPVPSVCPACGGEMRYAGFGTQRMEEELEVCFPAARILRMDLDTTGKKNAHANMLQQFAGGEYDILLGTQMVAKGLDFEKVSLVGVIGIDSLLFGQGYRAFETVFSLVTQVVGRSGRVGAQGRAVIQTMDVENPVLNLAAKQDYEAFYEQEIAFRKMALYPPFCVFCVAGFVAKTEAEALYAARQFAHILVKMAAGQPDIPLRVLGPAPMGVAMIAGSYRYRLTMKCRGDATFRELLQSVLAQYDKEGLPRKASVTMDFHSDAS